MKAIIFGASGQDGFYLKKLLAREQVETIGVARSRGDLIGDVADFEFVEQIVADFQPNFIFHLAANSTTSHAALFDNHLAISTGTLNILEAVRRRAQTARVFLAGSAVQFENSGAPIDETTRFAAASPYAVSRIESVYAARYFRQLGIRVYVGYFFNHDSPLRGEQHVNQKIVRAAQRIAAGSNEKLEIGDATTRKEFGFAGDAAAAAWILVNQTKVFEAVIGTGAAHGINEWLDLCFGLIDLNWKDHVTIKTDFKSEYRILVSNPYLIKSLGWQPTVEINELAAMMMAGTK